MTATAIPDLSRATDLLRDLLGERLLVPADADFATATRLWNAAVRREPVLVARCADAAEVADVVRIAHRCRLPLSVRAGGHDWAGRALRDGGVVVDLTGMRRVEVDPDAGTVTVAGGATAGDAVAAGRPHGLVVATGTVRTVGLAGLTLAGGYGPLCGRFGLALDNLLRADVVLADGREVTADPAHDAELYWALRGGGGNFGVVTRLTLRAHRVPAALAGMVMFGLDEAVDVLRGYRDLIAEAPDELTVMAGFLPGPQGEPLVFVCPVHAGADPGEGERYVDRIRAFGRPLVDQVASLPYEDVLRMFDGGMVDGNHYLLRTRWLPGLPDGAVEALVAAARQVSSPYSAIALHHFHGAATRVGAADTAFGLRTAHSLVEVIAAWAPADPAGPHREWADATSVALAPYALPGGYPNLLAPEETDRVLLAYGANVDRLRRAKRRYDPEGVFSAVPTLPEVRGAG
ncbi:FAD-binding oxidoreductase [Micromonospora mirobrigensis]|uniref:FAD/FMN-containing dehydrogenase n=1 Tax=Micromonospora mirobrigensis TaxID=262898 RepID=A0A1C5AAC0_9ACTN|nr:FAD-binding oxidoreductase [Micromonospora mirobrigensis]SCF42076.1 FAD/FMN-containing dehydrogenase [Micromonospora mirobrigensis]